MTDAPTKPLLILDLDETLIFAADHPLAHPCDFTLHRYFVYRRPHLTEFLNAAAANFELAVWSSSTADYVAAITDRIFPSQITLRFRWARDRCVQRYHPEWQRNYPVKDLKKVKRLGYDLSRVLIVDDTPSKCERNYGNAIYVSSFEGHTGDKELEALSRFLESLLPQEDFRQIEKRGWRSHYMQ